MIHILIIIFKVYLWGLGINCILFTIINTIIIKKKYDKENLIPIYIILLGSLFYLIMIIGIIFGAIESIIDNWWRLKPFFMHTPIIGEFISDELQ